MNPLIPFGRHHIDPGIIRAITRLPSHPLVIHITYDSSYVMSATFDNVDACESALQSVLAAHAAAHARSTSWREERSAAKEPNAERLLQCLQSTRTMLNEFKTIHSDLISAVQQCLPHVDKLRQMSGGEGDIAAMNARSILTRAKAML